MQLNTNVTDAGPFEKLLTVQIAEADLETAKAQAAHRLSKDLKIKGFRPGKAPRRIVEATVGPERLRSEAIDDLLPTLVADALREVDVRPAVPPQVENMKDIDSGLEVEVKVALWPVLDQVPAYEGLEIEVSQPTPTDEELERQVNRLRDQFADLAGVDRPAAVGDFVSINLTASKNGEQIEEAAANDLLYEVGSNSFVEGLDAELPGSTPGTIVKFNAPLPAGFGDRAGEEVTMQVLVKEVKQKLLPDLTDEWTAEVTEFATVEELREELRKQIEEVKRGIVRNELQAGVLESLLAEIDVLIPQAIVDAEMENTLHRLAHQLEGQGISISDYLRVTGQDQQVFVDDLRNQADRNVRTDLLLEAVAEAAGLEATRGELDEVVVVLAKQAERDVDEYRAEFAESAREKAVMGDILKRKALEVLLESAVPVDESGNRIELNIPQEDQEETVEA
jgi:trigger factor